jgi:alpha-N-arabinofuranosidase
LWLFKNTQPFLGINKPQTSNLKHTNANMYFLKTFMKYTALLFCCCLTAALLHAQPAYRNPVIPGFYPDPSVCRVGNDYYLINSSFEYFPGIPVWTSKDLVHWKQLGHVLTRKQQLPLDSCKPSNGIYAPTIRYHDGVFYVVVTLVSGNKGYQNFYVTATNPAGPWSNPVYVAQSGIDPSLFWDDDGKTYFLSNRATSSTDERAIYQSEIDINTGKLLSNIQQVWKGSGGSYVEGPHMYKKDGYYYLLTAEGGTAYGHTVAIGRSKNIWGPYESNPGNPLLTNRMSYGILQGTGHADIVQAPDSAWWMVHLAFRPAVDGIHFIGRETCLTPLQWKAGEWPQVLPNGQAQEQVTRLPYAYDATVPQPFNQPVTTHFDSPPGFEWMYLRNPDSSYYSLSLKKGWMALTGNPYTLAQLRSPTCMLRRQQHFNCRFATLIDFNPAKENEAAGLVVMMDNRFHYQLLITRNGNQRVVQLQYTLDDLHQLVQQWPLQDGPAELAVTADKLRYTFTVTQQGRTQTLGKLNTRFLGTEVSGGYNGVVMGIYASGNGAVATTPAYFDWVNYQP